ncbi:MAG: glycosyltransferase [[Clostridium] fimetarium]|nr:glycosyltransferase [Alistipes timonensis]MCM1405583.1 glycosyltransferase [[Clostridium] fimetarium]
MTILWIYNQPLVPEAGGTERITSLVAKGLSARGHNCLGILVFNDKDGSMTYDGKTITDLYTFLKEHGVDIVINQIAYAKWLLEAFLANGGDCWRSEGGRIISCLHFDPKSTSSLYYLCSIRHKTPRTYINIAKAFALYPYYARTQRLQAGTTYNWIYDHSDWFVTLSEKHFKYLKKVTHRDDYEKLAAINNPLTFDTISPESALSQKKKIILVCSRMDEYQKRISLVLKAWKALQTTDAAKDWQLKLVGTGPDIDLYKEYARKHNLQRISFEGRQSPEPYYEEASIFLMTSCGIEGWGLTITESLQKGVVPVVMNTCPVYSDIIDHCYNGYLSNGSDMNSFLAHIKSLISDQRRLQSMQRNALRSAGRFTLDKTMEKWEKIINRK